MKTGDKVVCINNIGATELIKDKIYKVRKVRPSTGGVKLIGVEMKDVEIYSGYFKNDRFRLVDLNFGAKVCEEIKQLIKEQELNVN